MHNKLRRQLEAAINEPGSPAALLSRALEALGGPVPPAVVGFIPKRTMHAAVTITPAMCEASLRPSHGVGAVEDDTPYDHAHDVATAEGMPEPAL